MARPSCTCAVLLALIAFLPFPASAQSALSQADSTPRPAGAPVTFGGDTLFTIYGSLGPFGPEERARAVERRVARWASALALGSDSVQVSAAENHSELLVGDEVIMTILEADAAPLGRPREALAAFYARRIQEVAAATIAGTSLRALALDTAKALAATLFLVLLVFALRALHRRLSPLLTGPHIRPFRIKRLELLSSTRLSEALGAIARAVRLVLTLVLLYFYVPLVLSFFPWTAPYSSRIIGYVTTPLYAVGVGALEYLPKLFFIVIIVLVTRYVLKFIHLLFRGLASGTLTLANFHPDWAEPTYKITRFLVIAFAAVVMFPYLPGAGSDAFKGISLFVGVLFSLGSSGAVGNIVAGVVLTYTNAFQIGDRVQIGETIGDVVERTMLITRIRTIKNVDITVPNGTVLTTQVINYTTQAARRGLILHTTVTIGYDAPWRRVHELLIAAAAATEHILPKPAPFVLQTSLDDFYVSYQLNAYTDRPSLMARTYSELHQRIQDAFNEGGVEILSPHYRALRDGNEVTIPAEHRSKDYQAPAFRMEQVPPDGHRT